jgi:pimeloyl-ACP methyl ester carboxylesterase
MPVAFPFPLVRKVPSLLGIALTLGLCACSSSLPSVRIAKERLPQGGRPKILNGELAAALAVAESGASDGKGSLAAYNKAVEDFVFSLQRRVSPKDWNKPVVVANKHGRSWEVRFDDQPEARQGMPEWSPGYFDRILPASSFDLKCYHHRVHGDGVGVPVVMAYEDIEHLRKARSFRPGNGLYVPGTVVLDFGKPIPATGAVPVRMKIVNTFEHRDTKLRGSKTALAYDITSAVEMNLANSYIMKSGLAGLLNPGKRATDFGLFAIGAYDPKKIPVLFVHGLGSDTRIWKNAINELYADPHLNSHYQPLLFLYPTGGNVPASALRLRDSLKKYRDKWDPDHNDPGFKRMVLVGHSMGGLLSRMQAIDSGNDISNAFFSCPVSEVPWITASYRTQLGRALVFKREPFVDRVIFVAVPHRGSDIADWAIVRLAIRLISLPLDATEFVAKALLEDQNKLNPMLLKYNLLGFRSVDMLSPEHPFVQAIEKRPIKVPFHSIIGDRGKGNSPNSSDGAVPYWSSHLEKATSEKIVPYGHSCTDKPETVEEIVRILHEHLRAK